MVNMITCSNCGANVFESGYKILKNNNTVVTPFKIYFCWNCKSISIKNKEGNIFRVRFKDDGTKIIGGG